MNKNEYLAALKTALEDTEQNVMEEIVSDYEEHFQVGIQKGKSEEQICKELGSIDDLVEDIKEVYHADFKEEDKKTEEEKEKEEYNEDLRNNKFINLDIGSIDGKRIGNAINGALDSAGEAISNIDVVEIGHNIKNTIDQAASSLNNFADSYLKNSGWGSSDSDNRKAEGNTENVSKSYDESEDIEDETATDYNETENLDDMEPHRESEDLEDLGLDSETIKSENNDLKKEDGESEKTSRGLNLTIDGICANVYVSKSSNGKININYVNNGNERQKQMYEFYSYKQGNIVYAGIRRVGRSVFLFNLKTNSINIYVELPENMGDVNIKTASGDIKIGGVNPNHMTIQAASGDVSINHVDSTDTRIKCSSGDISIRDMKSIQIAASTMSGDVEAYNIEAKNLLLKSLSGDVEGRNLSADIINNSSMSGDLEMDSIKASECKIRSTNGDIKINGFTMNNADVSSVSGDLKLSNITGDGLRVCSTSGDLNLLVNVKMCHASSKSGDVAVKCNGDTVLESSSISGDLRVDLKNYGNGFSVKSRTTTGELYINYNDMHQRNLKTGVYTYGNQGSELILGTVSGDIHVND